MKFNPSKTLYYTGINLITQKDIRGALVRAGLARGDIVMVHSDTGTFGRLGDITDKDEFLRELLDAFIGVIGNEGTLIVPTYTYSFCKGEVFDVKNTPSTVGVFTEFVRKQKNAVRSEDPIFSHAGIGEGAEALLRNIGARCFGEDSFFDRFYKAGGKIVNFGKEFDITFLHYIENAFKVNYRFEKKFSGVIVREDRVRQRTDVIYYARFLPEDGKDVQYDMSRLENELDKRKLIKKIPLGNNYVICSRARDCFDVGFQMLKRNEYAFLKNNPDVLEFKKFPFYVGLFDSPDNKGFPLNLPIKIEFNKASGLISRGPSKQDEEYLKKAYRIGSVASVNLGDGSFGVRKAEEALRHLLAICEKPVSESSFLEIGCADGYLLYRLKSLGAMAVAGCEPGPMAKAGKEKFGIDIINEFFTPGLFDTRFDIVFSYTVLEHMVDPAHFIGSQEEVLKEDGKLFAAVPNCERKLNLGDTSVIGHEHFNYFTAKGLRNLLVKCGLCDVDAVVGINEAMIYAWGTKSSGGQEEEEGHSDEALFYNFSRKVKTILPILNEKIKRLEAEGKTVGLYGGGLNVIGLLDYKSEPRFFNTDIAIHGKYYPGYKNPVEGPQGLLTGEVAEVWIMAVDYDREIRDYLTDELGLSPTVKLFSFKEFLENN